MQPDTAQFEMTNEPQDVRLPSPTAGLAGELVPAGTAPDSAPTHFWCSWQVTPVQAAALANQFGAGNARGRIMRPGVAPDEPQVVRARQSDRRQSR